MVVYCTSFMMCHDPYVESTTVRSNIEVLFMPPKSAEEKEKRRCTGSMVVQGSSKTPDMHSPERHPDTMHEIIYKK
jgi:hypothetical protein